MEEYRPATFKAEHPDGPMEVTLADQMIEKARSPRFMEERKVREPEEESKTAPKSRWASARPLEDTAVIGGRSRSWDKDSKERKQWMRKSPLKDRSNEPQARRWDKTDSQG